MPLPLTQQSFIDAHQRGLQIRHERKDTLYNILAIGKAKDDNANEWLPSVTYSNGDEVYTRFIRDMGGFSIQREEDVIKDNAPRYMTVVFEYHNSGAFRGLNGILSSMMQSYSPENPPVVGVVASSLDNEILRLEMIEAEIEHDNGDKSEVMSILQRSNLQYLDLVEQKKELDNDAY